MPLLSPKRLLPGTLCNSDSDRALAEAGTLRERGTRQRCSEGQAARNLSLGRVGFRWHLRE